MTSTTRTPTTGPGTASGVALGLPVGHVLSCGVCRLPGDTVAGRAEAELLARTHDDLHHGGHPTMQITAGGTCESCGRRRAVRAWHYPPAGAAFQLCTDCLPTPTSGSPSDGVDDVDRSGWVIDLRDHPTHRHQDDQAHPAAILDGGEAQ